MGKKKKEKRRMEREEKEIEKEIRHEEEKIKEVVDTNLEESKVIAFEKGNIIYDAGYYGKQIGDRLELALVEALLLLKRGRIRVLKDKKTMTFQELFDHALSLDKRTTERFRVYEDLRERGLLVRTGYKFGCDFRVYERGVQLKKGPKSAKEHTKWIVFCVSEDYLCSFQELSRAVRLAHNIRARMLWAIVDNEGDCTYIMITRHKP